MDQRRWRDTLHRDFTQQGQGWQAEEEAALAQDPTLEEVILEAEAEESMDTTESTGGEKNGETD